MKKYLLWLPILLMGLVQANAQTVKYDSYEHSLGGVWRYEIVRPEYRFTWSGLTDYASGGSTVNVSSAQTAAQIEAAINGAAAGAKVVFAAGTYTWEKPVEISRGDIRLEASGAVVLSPTFSAGWGNYAIEFKGTGLTGTSSTITGGLTEHSYLLTLNSTSGFYAGDWVRLDAYAEAMTYPSGNQVIVSSTEVHRMATLAKIVAVRGDTLELDRKAAFPAGWLIYPDQAVARVWRPIENIAISGNFSVDYTSLLGTVTGGTNSNDASGWSAYGSGVAAVKFENAARVGIDSIRTINSPSTGFWFAFVADAYLTQCGAYGAHNRGSGGQGYAMLHEGCTNIRARAWQDERMRHSWATSLNTSSVALDVEIDTTESNPEFSHGGFDRLLSIRVQVLSPHQELERYRPFDHREVKVLSRNAGWIGTMAGLKPYGEYDFSFASIPGVNGTFDFRNTGSDHKPGFRDAPNAQYETYVGDAGFNTLNIIAMGHGARMLINPGTHTITTNNPRGNVFFVPEVDDDTTTTVTFTNFRTTPERVRRADLILIAQQGSIVEYSDLSITGATNGVISLPNGSSITVTGVAGSALTEEFVKVISPERLARIYHRMGVQYQFKGSDPYIRKTYPAAGGSDTTLYLIWNEPMELSGSGSGLIYNSGTTQLEALSASNLAFSGDTVFIDPSSVSAGTQIKVRFDPGFFRSVSGSVAGQGMYDWHEDVVYSNNYFTEYGVTYGTPTVDTLAPDTVTGLSVTAYSTSATVSWSAASDPSGVSYKVLIGDSLVRTTTALKTDLSGLTASTGYTVGVVSRDGVGNESDTATVSFTTDAPDVTAPGTVDTIYITVASTSATISWPPVPDPSQPVLYEVYLVDGGDVFQGDTTGLGWTITGLTASTAYGVKIRAKDGANNSGSKSSSYAFTTAEADATPPSTIDAPTISNETANSFTAAWDTATDAASGVSYYQLAVDADTFNVGLAYSYTVTGLASGENYTVTVRAVDGEGNAATWSAEAIATTLPENDNTAPGYVTGITVNPGTTTATVTWSAVSDPSQPISYEVYLVSGGDVYQGDTTGLGWTITGLTAGTSYAVKLRAVDAAGNSGSKSAAVSFTTYSEAIAPGVPTGLAVSAVDTTTATASWTPTGGATSYTLRIDSAGVLWNLYAGLTDTTYNLTCLTSGKSYSATVRAHNSGGFSDYSDAVAWVAAISSQLTRVLLQKGDQQFFDRTATGGGQQRILIQRYNSETGTYETYFSTMWIDN